MNLESMSYKNYIWKNNPHQIEITQAKNIKECVLPFNGNVLQDLGNKKRIVSGQGSFFGQDCMEQYNNLKKVFEEGGTGYLSVPGVHPFLAAFHSLNLLRKSLPNIVEYSFKFWEELKYGVTVGNNDEKQYHTVKAGETLWTIAIEYNTTVSRLLVLNKDIKRPDNLDVGLRVIIE